MGRAIVPGRSFSLPVACLAAGIGLFVSTGESPAQQPANSSRAAPPASQMGEAAQRESARQWSLENDGCHSDTWYRREGIAMQLAIAFDQAVKEHAAGTDALAWLQPGQQAVSSPLVPERQNRERPLFHEGFRTLSGTTLYDESQAMEKSAERLLAAGNREGVAEDVAIVCLKIAQGYLNHDKPQYRAVACEFLSLFPLQISDERLLERLSNECREDLLAHLPREVIDEGPCPPLRGGGDSAKAFDGARLVMECSASADRTTTRTVRHPAPAYGVFVADVARQTLAVSTDFKFQDARTFDVWWRGYGNKDCRRRLWYWAVRWKNLPLEASPPPAIGQSKVAVTTPAPSRVSVETDFPALVAAIGPDEGLKTLLLAASPAVAVQSGGSTWPIRVGMSPRIRVGMRRSPRTPPNGLVLKG